LRYAKIGRTHLAALLGTGTLILGIGLPAALPSALLASAHERPPGSDRTIVGTVTIARGPLSMTGPAAIKWSTRLNGLAQMLTGSSVEDASYTVTDATGSGDGWTMTASAGTFTAADGSALPGTDALVFNGDAADPTAAVMPGAACRTGSACSLPVNDLAYPVTISTTQDGISNPVTVYESEAGTGLGAMDIGAKVGAPAEFWLKIPANAKDDTYTSTVTMSVSDGFSGYSWHLNLAVKVVR
jgi:WxL domain surface cell wall-binding